MNDKDFYKNMKQLANFTYFGISMISPLIICILIGGWLQKKFQMGNYVMIIAIILGVGGGVMTFYDFYKRNKKENSKTEDK